MQIGNNGAPIEMGAQGQVISLSKGQKIDLSKTVPGLTRALIGLGWDANGRDGFDFDLDASAFLLNAQGKARGIENFIFYNNMTGVNSCCLHQGDNLTGDGDGDDEQIIIDFARVPAEINKIAIAVTIFEAEERKQNFGQVTNAYIRVADDMTQKELIKYDLGEDYSTETALVVAEFYKKDDTWRMGAVGAGYAGGLKALAQSYGLQIG